MEAGPSQSKENASASSISSSTDDQTTVCNESDDKWWLRLSEYFEFVSSKDDDKNIVFSCKLCRPKIKTICAAFQRICRTTI